MYTHFRENKEIASPCAAFFVWKFWSLEFCLKVNGVVKVVKKARLTKKQNAFVQEYLSDPHLNATQAAIRAGYSEKTARNIAAENLAKPNIQAAIQKSMDKRAQRTEITQDKVLKELARLGFANMSNYVKWGPSGVTLKSSDELTEDETAAVAEVSETVTESGSTIRFKLHDKKGTLELIGRHLKLFNDKLDINANMDAKIKHTHTVDLTTLSDEELNLLEKILKNSHGPDET